MDTLDSRSLSYVDCYARKFAVAGRVRYHLVSAAGAWLPVGEQSFAIEVAQRRGGDRTGRQHNVSVLRSGKSLVAEPPHLKIEVGDIVLWHAADAGVPGFAVVGEGEGGAFNSAAMGAEAVYTHAFGTPGDYRWVDANGGKLRGLVHVRALERTDKEEFDKWMATLKNGSLIAINGTKATPERVEILVGQTVFWTVENAPGISITDERLVRG